jgi:DNA topoisomerase IB
MPVDRVASEDQRQTAAAITEAIELSAAVGLVYVSDGEPGLRRVRRGGRFAYLGADDRALRDAKTLQRIASLAIPPAYERVWICAHERGHLQATGFDARGRKQYRYHPEWRAARDGAKFERMIAFGEALPRLRRRVSRDLALPGLPRDKVIAVVVGLLDATRIRIGNVGYARDNASFGLTTLEDRHVRFVRDGRARFSFRGKGGLAHDVTVDSKRLSRIVRHCHHLPGQQLFQYLDDAGDRHPITSDQVNAYLQDAMGEDFTAKGFRTWSATLSAITLMAATPLPEEASERACKTAIVAAIRAVAAELRNTPTVAKKSYINPLVFTAWQSGSLHKTVTGDLKGAPRKSEQVALAFLRAESRRAARAAKRAATRDGAPDALERSLKKSLAAARTGTNRSRPKRP